jgi:hypothetical protein
MAGETVGSEQQVVYKRAAGEIIEAYIAAHRQHLPDLSAADTAFEEAKAVIMARFSEPERKQIQNWVVMDWPSETVMAERLK